MKHDDAFDNWLTRNLQEKKPYLSDEGFTQNVMAELPKRSALQNHIQTIIALPVITITLLVLWQLPLGHMANTLWHLLAELDFKQLLLIGTATSASLLLGICIWLARQMRLI